MRIGGEKWGYENFCPRNMFLGSYAVSLDQKGRIAVPKRFRTELGAKLVVARWYEECLVLVSDSTWQKIVSGITSGIVATLSGRDTDRFLLGGSFEVELDHQGRFIIPQNLRYYAHINKEVICAGLDNRLEIWDKVTWEQREQTIIKEAGNLAEKLFEQQKEQSG